MTIWKFPLRITDLQSIAMPAGAELLAVQGQGGFFQLWARVDPAARPVRRLIACCGTGHPASDGRYISTAQQNGGVLVWHFFDEGEKP